MSFTLEWLNCTAVSKSARAAHVDIRALVLERTDGKARTEVESSADEFEIARALGNVELDLPTLESFAFRSFKINRMIALHPNASAQLLAKLSQSPDKPTRRNVARNPQTSKEVLLNLAPTFAGEFFLNPAFDFLLMEDPNLLFSLPVGVLKNILKI